MRSLLQRSPLNLCVIATTAMMEIPNIIKTGKTIISLDSSYEIFKISYSDSYRVNEIF